MGLIKNRTLCTKTCRGFCAHQIEYVSESEIFRNVVEKNRQGFCGFLGGFVEYSRPVAGKNVPLVQCLFIDVSNERCVLMSSVYGVTVSSCPVFMVLLCPHVQCLTLKSPN